MGKIIFVTGGQRSGKSAYAKGLVESISANPVYLATARYWDDDFRERIKRHQQDRDNRWQTIEKEVNLSELDLNNRVVLLDCITLWLTNIFSDNNYLLDKSLEKAKNEWTKFISQEFTLIVVSNEIGMGVHAQDEASRHFTDLQGWMNQFIAKTANEVYLCISGISIKIK